MTYDEDLLRLCNRWLVVVCPAGGRAQHELGQRCRRTFAFRDELVCPMSGHFACVTVGTDNRPWSRTDRAQLERFLRGDSAPGIRRKSRRTLVPTQRCTSRGSLGSTLSFRGFGACMHPGDLRAKRDQRYGTSWG